MSVRPDSWIRRMSVEHKMIEPFTDRQIRGGIIMNGELPSATYTAIFVLEALATLAIGALVFRRQNRSIADYV